MELPYEIIEKLLEIEIKKRFTLHKLNVNKYERNPLHRVQMLNSKKRWKDAEQALTWFMRNTY